MCPGATGMSHHVSPSGALEFCPVIQLATDFLNSDASNMTELYARSQFLAGMRKQIAQATRGCIVMDNPELMVQILKGYPVQETTTRGTAMQEYTNTIYISSHDMEPDLIPEKSRPYRWLKRNYFFGFGAYG